MREVWAGVGSKTSTRCWHAQDIDAVFVTSPTNQHAEHVVAAAHAGKGVLLQKPMALTLEDCDTIIDVSTLPGSRSGCATRCAVDPINTR